MSFILKYRLLLLMLVFLAFGLVLSFILKLDDLWWLYIIGTPLLAAMMGLLTNFFINTAGKKLISKSAWVTVGLGLLFFTAIIIHLTVYVNTTFLYPDLNNIKRTYIKGYTYTDIAIKYRRAHPSLNSDYDLLFNAFGGTDGIRFAWTPASVNRATIHLIVSYFSTVLFLSALLSWILVVAYEKRYMDPQRAMKAILAEKGVSNYEKYLLTSTGKHDQEKYKAIKAHVFLSYASDQRDIAEKIFYSLANNGHMTFFDRNQLPAGLEYNAAIRAAINHSDIFIFMISPDSVIDGHYTISELKFASEKWPAASGVLLPVMSVATPFEQIPAYPKSVTILVPRGDLVAEVTAEVEKLYDLSDHH